MADQTSRPTATDHALIDFHRVSVMRGDKIVLDDLTFRVDIGEHVAILGPNGCGKSTLIKTITRECYPLQREGSRMSIFGKETWNVFDLRSLLGIVSNDLMSQCTRDITGRDIVLSGFFSSIGVWPHHQVSAAMREKAQEVLEILEAPHLAGRPVNEMSSGEARRILIARALVHDPRALVFDEPSNSLDVCAQHELRQIMRKLAQSGIAILLVTHHLAEIIPEIDRILLMREGRIVADGPKDRILKAECLSDLFGVPVELGRRDGYYHLW
jgi:iron complex transport system ATP-binding protein